MKLINEIKEHCKNEGDMLSDLFRKYVIEFAPLEDINTGYVLENEKKEFNFLLLEQSNLVQKIKLDTENICNTMNMSSEIKDLTKFSQKIDDFLVGVSKILSKWKEILYNIYLDSNNMCFQINETIDVLKIENRCLFEAFENIGFKFEILYSKNYTNLRLEYVLESTMMTSDIACFEAVSEVLKKMMIHFNTLTLTHKLQIILDFKDIRHKSFSKFKQFSKMLISSFELFDPKSKNSIQHHFQKLCNLDIFLYKEMNRCSKQLSAFTFKFKKIRTTLENMTSSK